MNGWCVVLIVALVFVVLLLVWRPAAPRDQSEHDPVWPDVQRDDAPSE